MNEHASNENPDGRDGARSLPRLTSGARRRPTTLRRCPSHGSCRLYGSKWRTMRSKAETGGGPRLRGVHSRSDRDAVLRRRLSDHPDDRRVCRHERAHAAAASRTSRSEPPHARRAGTIRDRRSGARTNRRQDSRARPGPGVLRPCELHARVPALGGMRAAGVSIEKGATRRGPGPFAAEKHGLRTGRASAQPSDLHGLVAIPDACGAQ